MARMTVLVVVGLLLLAGCASSGPAETPAEDESTSVTTPAPTTTTTEPTSTKTKTTAVTPTADASTTTATTAATTVSESGLHVSVDGETAVDSSAYTALTISVRGDTEIGGADLASDGDPYYSVSLDGERVAKTDSFDPSAESVHSIEVPERSLEPFAGEEVTVNVSLWDADLGSDDHIRSATTTIRVASERGATSTSTLSTSETTTTTPSTTATAKTTTTPTTTRTTTTQTTAVTTTARTTTELTTTETTTRTTTSQPTTAQQSEWEVTIVRVVDGDTLEVRFPNGETGTLRILGVDTPEVHVENDPSEFEGVPNTEDGRDWLRDWGHKASEFARTELAGETVTIETDDTADRRGSYGRLLVYVYHDGSESFNRELIERGYARLYDTTFSKRSAFATAESTARQNGVGLWDYESPQTTTEHADGGDSGLLVVESVHADASGNDHENENDEYIVFRNTGESPLDLSGWTVSDEADHTFTFPDVVVQPGATITLYTGSGETTNTEAYWGSGSAIWNNGGDTIIVENAEGETVIRYEYGSSSVVAPSQAIAPPLPSLETEVGPIALAALVFSLGRKRNE